MGNVTVTLGKKQYHVLYVGIHGGSGMGANYPYNGRYYLVSSDIWEKNKDNYCMVHDSVLPQAWKYYENNGFFLLEEKEHPGRITKETLIACISHLELELRELMGTDVRKGEPTLANYRELFTSQSLDQSHYVAVLYEEEPSCFYEALMEVVWVGGTCGGYLKYKARALSLDAVGKLARKSGDRRAEKYVDISETNWQELLSR